MTRIDENCTHIIDLHTGAVARNNLPQIRAFLTGEKLKHCPGHSEYLL
ncbi:MAG: hypothetical protein R2741_05585 [Methanolobus sp.]